MDSKDLIVVEDLYGAHNYHPLDVVVSKAKGIWMYDVEGRKYLDFLSSYSAVNQGHRHPRIVKALIEPGQEADPDLAGLPQRPVAAPGQGALRDDRLQMVLPMNSGAEAVETAVKTARKWAYQKKGVPQDRAEIIACANNFHGRTVTVISFSTEPLYRQDFGPFTPGFTIIPFGDAEALEKAITPEHGGLPRRAHPGRGRHPHPARRLPEAGRARSARRTTSCSSPTRSRPASAGPASSSPASTRASGPTWSSSASPSAAAAIPISAVLADREILGVFKPGEHGSTFGGNPLACAVARESLRRHPRGEARRERRRARARTSSRSCARSAAGTSRRSAAAGCSSASSSSPKPAAPAASARS